MVVSYERGTPVGWLSYEQGTPVGWYHGGVSGRELVSLAVERREAVLAVDLHPRYLPLQLLLLSGRMAGLLGKTAPVVEGEGLVGAVRCGSLHLRA